MIPNTDNTANERTLREAADAYYNGVPLMSDAEYDRLWRSHRSSRVDTPDDPIWSDTILDRVGAEPSTQSGFAKVVHRTPMLSLDNVFVGEEGSLKELFVWLQGLTTAVGRVVTVRAEPKIDGLSLSLDYHDGVLVRAVTRGNGEIGDDVTTNVLAGKVAPDQLRGARAGEMTVRGEVYMTFADFEELNAEQERSGEPPYANPRNAAAGILRRKDPTGVRRLSFMLHGIETPVTDSYAMEIARMTMFGFRCPPYIDVLSSLLGMEELNTAEKLKQAFDEQVNFPIDGVVFKIHDLTIRAQLGMTSRAPRWAVALKFEQEEQETILANIIVQVGRQGVLTPVAILRPVVIDGTTVSRASLHNQDQVNRLGLKVGDRVMVRKAAAIIPEISRSLTAAEAHKRLCQENPVDAEALEEAWVKARKSWSLPDHIKGKCPSCGSTDLRRADESMATAWTCGNTAGCRAQMAGRIEHMAGRDCLNIDQLGGETCDEIAFRAGLDDILHPFDLLKMPTGYFAALSWTTESGGKMTFGEGRAKKVVEAIRAAKQLPLNRWIASLGIPTIGRNTSKEISRLFRTVDVLRRSCGHTDGVLRQMLDSFQNDPKQVVYEELKTRYQISGRLGPVSLERLVEFVNSEDGDYALSRIPPTIESDNYDPEPTGEAEGPLSGKTFVVTGTLSVPRHEVERVITLHGGKLAGSVSKSTTAVVAGDKAGSKLEKAQKLGIPVWSEADLKEACQ